MGRLVRGSSLAIISHLMLGGRLRRCRLLLQGEGAVRGAVTSVITGGGSVHHMVRILKITRVATFTLITRVSSVGHFRGPGELINCVNLGPVLLRDNGKGDPGVLAACNVECLGSILIRKTGLTVCGKGSPVYG